MWNRVYSAFLVWVGVCAVPFMACAHATPITYEPEAGASLREVPSLIVVSFTERIEEGASSLTVFAPDGTKVNMGKGVLDAEDARLFSVPIEGKGEGVYSVSWQVVSVDDGHFTKGSYSFLVSESGAAFEGDSGGTTEVVYSSKLPDAVLGFGALLGESLWIAVLVFLLAIIGPLKKRSLLAEGALKLQMLAFHVVSIGFALFTGTTLIALIRKSAELSVLQDATLTEGLVTYVSSSVGMFAVAKLLLAVAFFALFWTLRSRLLALPLWSVFGLVTSLLGILTLQSYVSHAAASLFLPEVSIFITFLHLITKEFVIGGIVVVFCTTLVLYKSNPLGLARIVRQFDVFASVALLVAALSGTFITWLHLKSFTHLSETEWGERFVVLLVCALVLGCVRLIVQLYISPRFHRAHTRRLLLIALPVEIVLGILVLFFSGYSAITTPSFTVEQYSYTHEVVSEGVLITMDVHPYERDMFRLTFLDASSLEAVEPKNVVLTAVNTPLQIGPNVVDLAQRFVGGYVFRRDVLTPGGTWELSLQVQKESGYDAHTSITLKYPDEVEATKYSNDVRTFDSFAFAHLCIGIGMSVFFIVLTYVALRVQRMTNKQKEKFEKSTHVRKPLFLGVVLALLIFVLLCVGLATFVQSDLQKACTEDGFLWVQAYPTRDFEATAKNAVMGCTVHDGHYHIADYREYLYMRDVF